MMTTAEVHDLDTYLAVLLEAIRRECIVSAAELDGMSKFGNGAAWAFKKVVKIIEDGLK